MAALEPPERADPLFMRLSDQAPRHYRTWVRAAIAATLVAYSIAFASLQLDVPDHYHSHPREPYVIAAALVALWLERRGRLRAAAGVILTAIWFELHLSLLFIGPRAAIGGVFPAVLTGVILFFGTRVGRRVALSALVSVPAVVLAGPYLSLGPGMRRGDLIFLVAVEASTLAIALMLGLLMNTLSNVLSNAERDARRVRELIDGAPDAIIAANQQGVIEDCNPSAEALFQRTRAALLGQPFESLRLYASNPAGDAALVTIQALGPEPREFWLPDGGAASGSDGQTPLEGNARTVTRADGSRDSLVVLRDLTQRKLSEERTAHLQRQLQHAQKLEALGKLAGGVAHDFNNLLMAVGGYGEALSQHPDDRVRLIANGLMGLRQRAAGLTGHLLAFARKGMTQPLSMDLSLAVRDSKQLLEDLIGPKVELHIDAPGPALIYADPAQIEQILMNLALNARDAMPMGGVLTIGCRCLAELERVELSVMDTGHGMDETTRRSAFEPFFTTKPRGQGTGLGLALVHGIMDASGGTIALESRPGQGTSFTLSWQALRRGGDSAPVSDAASLSGGKLDGAKVNRTLQH